MNKLKLIIQIVLLLIVLAACSEAHNPNKLQSLNLKVDTVYRVVTLQKNNKIKTISELNKNGLPNGDIITYYNGGNDIVHRKYSAVNGEIQGWKYTYNKNRRISFLTYYFSTSEEAFVFQVKNDKIVRLSGSLLNDDVDQNCLYSKASFDSLCSVYNIPDSIQNSVNQSYGRFIMQE